MQAMLFNAITIATPLFGFSLDCPLDEVALAPPSELARAAQGRVEDETLGIDLDSPDEDAPLNRGAILDPDAGDASARSDALAVYGALHLATWISMAATAVLGVIQLYDDYGFADSENETPCVRNEAVFGFCDDEAPIPHMIGAGTTAALYATTFVVGFTIPDPMGVEDSNTREGSRWRAHEVLRWLHLASLGLQVAFGAITAHAGLDFETRQSFAWVHLGLAVSTFSLFTADGVLLFF